MTFSIGIATRTPDETVSADRLRMKANEALYGAKHIERSRGSATTMSSRLWRGRGVATLVLATTKA